MELSHTSVYELLCSTNTYPVILRHLRDLLDEFVLSPSQETIYERFIVRRLSFAELHFETQQFLTLQLAVVLEPEFVVDRLSIHLFSVYSGPPERDVNWFNVLSLISSLAVSVKGGVLAVKNLIRKLLGTVFCKQATGEDLGDALIQCEFFQETSNASATQFSPQELKLFASAILIARQLCSEDIRITGVSYTQWWSELFCSASTDRSGLIRSRAGIVLLSSLLLELLPCESDPRLLQIQLFSQPFRCLLRKLPVKNKVAQSANIDEVREDAPTSNEDLVPDTYSELDALDAIYVDCCSRCWRDYVEVGRGRLAELRDLREADSILCAHSPVIVHATGSCSMKPPGWDDVFTWFTEVAKQMRDNRPFRLPHGLTEANLFQPRRLREVLIPVLLHASELSRLPAELISARSRLILGIKEAGLSQLLFKETGEKLAQLPVGSIASSRQMKTSQSLVKRPTRDAHRAKKSRRKC
ncbi:uncharacterized protein DEA37_0003659 [Paragonimus westermani]|uniref:Uncharacterized protein n=1 Tax=Paragonimus westermani TaxID=34504 RepID=A0A5J4NA39_9TREM|nr:uncharacterized protein DEA37_0003659 [Paragonimus westermani]